LTARPSNEELERTVRMKDGRTALIRLARLEDMPDVMEMDRAVLLDGRGSVRTADELVDDLASFTEKHRAYIDGNKSGVGGCWLVAEVEGRVVAGGTIHRLQPGRVRHNAQIGLGVHPEYQGLGLGRAIMVGLLDWARLHSAPTGRATLPPIRRVMLNVMANNERAIALYTSLGFRIIGTRTRFIRFEDGSECNDHEMELLLDE